MPMSRSAYSVLLALKEWQVSHPQLAAWAEKNLPEGSRSLSDLPEAHRVRMRTTNGLELHPHTPNWPH